jgi:DNA repair protein RecO (recombination protein O)
MQWNDKAIILSVRRLGENAGVVHLLAAEHGMAAGVDRGAFGKRKRGIYQPGNIVAAHWQARLPEHMGTLNCELTQDVASHLLDDRYRLAALTSATLMAARILAERETQPAVFACMESLVHALHAGHDWLKAYVLLEFMLLECAGFGLDLARCAATGQGHDLLYVSPRTGRAVSREAGAPYHEKMFLLPAFLAAAAARSTQNVSEPDITQLLAGIRLCGHFLEERVFTPRNIPVPAARRRFVEMLGREEKEAVF